MSDNTRTSRENIDNASVYADTSRDVADKGRHDAGSVGNNAKGARVVVDTQRTLPLMAANTREMSAITREMSAITPTTSALSLAMPVQTWTPSARTQTTRG